MFLNTDQAAVDHNLFEILTERNLWVWFSLASSFMTLVRELYGRANLGQGALKTEGIDIKVFPVIDFNAFKKEDIKQIRRILANISARPIADISVEFK